MSITQNVSFPFYHTPKLSTGFQELTVLNMSHVGFYEFPSEMIGLKNLIKLNVSNNYLICLPKEVSSMKNLCVLDLSHNKFSTLPLGIRFMQLKQLSTSNNPFGPSLKELLWLRSTPNGFKLAGMKNPLFLLRYPLEGVSFQTYREDCELYFGLKDRKWLELIDGDQHYLGREVFDTGAHCGPKEHGYIDSLENACIFVLASLHRKMDADWYLQLHRYACAHCDGKHFTNMTKACIGTFRGLEEINLKVYTNPSDEAKMEFEDFEDELRGLLGSNFKLASFECNSKGKEYIKYYPIPDYQMHWIVDWLFIKLYQELDKASAVDSKLATIAKFHQRIMWLHPPEDGTYRTNNLILNKLLVENGMLPVILEDPSICVDIDLYSYIEILIEGMREWQRNLDDKPDVHFI